MGATRSQHGTTTATTTVGALYTADQANTTGLEELIIDPEGAIAYGFNSAVTYANGTRLAAGEKAAIPIKPGARCYVITSSGTATVRWALNSAG